MGKNESQPKTKQTLGEFMSEKRLVDRWFALKVGLIGAFAGACLAILFVLRAVIPI